MTIKFVQATAAILRRAESVARSVAHTRRARLTGADGSCNPRHEVTASRYFGLLVHVDRPDR
jgi:hypothetical protein